MRFIKLGRWIFTVSDIKWLEKQAVVNELAADVLAGYYKKHGKRLS